MNTYQPRESTYHYIASKLDAYSHSDLPSELSPTFSKELCHYRSLLNEVFGMNSQQQKKICFLAEGLLGAALFYKAFDLQNALKDVIFAAAKEEASQSLLTKVNSEIDALLCGNH